MEASFQAVLKDKNIIEVAVLKSYTSSTISSFKFYEDEKYIKDLSIISKSESKSTFIYTLSISFDFKIGHEYSIADDRQERTPLSINIKTIDENYENNFRYDGSLGALYSKEATTFRLFTPMSSSVFVHIITKDNREMMVKMNRLECGVFEAVVEGDLECSSYTYIAKINGKFVEAPDPYSFALSSNSTSSYVVSLDKVKEYYSNISDNRPHLTRYTEAVIYEMSVRDMTSLTNLTNKGQYEALSATNLKDMNGFPIGLDYIKGLGINYVQLLPIYDFQTIDDDHPFESYNWGYDPRFYFCPEGSFSSNPNDPYCRLLELKKMIAIFHENGIGVIMDVVYNHVFNANSNALNVLCPGYYFRKNNDGTISNGSGCGNDVESRNYMARKLIIDSLLHFVDVYSIDGFRFDLMGIIDIETMNLAYKKLKEKREDIILYGEGWDLMTNLPGDQKSSLYNADKIKPIGLFNDRFRDIVKGKSSDSELANKGYLTGDLNYIDGFKNVLLGSSITLAFPPLFSSPGQSINYVECHDNATLYDKVIHCCPEAKENEILSIIKLINAVTILSFGIPFIHAGQEFGATKKNITNSYNSGDSINGLNYDLAFKRQSMIKFLNDAIKLKRSLPFLATDDKKELIEHVSFENIDGGGLAVIYRFTEDTYYLLINPSDKTLKYQFKNYVKVLFNEAGLLDDSHYAQLIMINKCSLIMVKTTK